MVEGGIGLCVEGLCACERVMEGVMVCMWKGEWKRVEGWMGRDEMSLDVRVEAKRGGGWVWKGGIRDEWQDGGNERVVCVGGAMVEGVTGFMWKGEQEVMCEREQMWEGKSIGPYS